MNFAEAKEGASMFGVIAAAISLALAPLIGLVLWTNRNLDFWVSWFKGEEVDVSILLSMLLILFAPVVVLANIIGEIARLMV